MKLFPASREKCLEQWGRGGGKGRTTAPKNRKWRWWAISSCKVEGQRLLRLGSTTDLVKTKGLPTQRGSVDHDHRPWHWTPSISRRGLDWWTPSCPTNQSGMLEPARWTCRGWTSVSLNTCQRATVMISCILIPLPSLPCRPDRMLHFAYLPCCGIQMWLDQSRTVFLEAIAVLFIRQLEFILNVFWIRNRLDKQIRWVSMIRI